MSLSFTEKRDLQKAIKTNLEQLMAGNLSFSEKRVAQKAIRDALDKLKGATSKIKKSLFDRLMSGEFISERPMGFLDIVRKVLDEVKDLRLIHEPILAYIKRNYTDGDAILEDVGQTVVISIDSSTTQDVLDRLSKLLNKKHPIVINNNASGRG